MVGPARCCVCQSTGVLIPVAEYEKPVGEADEGKSSLAFVQLEKHNERLKEALIR